MEFLAKQFYRSLGWNSVESIGYHFTLMAHQVLLFRTIGADVYGVVGITFSIMYLATTILNGGFNVTIGTFWHEYTQSKYSFRHLFLVHALPTYFLLVLITGIVFYASLAPLPPSLLLITAGIAFFESIKKTCKAVLYLTFDNKRIAFIELFTILSYVSLVWGLYLNGCPLEPTTIFMPLLLVSLISAAFLVSAVYHLYQSLPDTESTSFFLWPIHKRIITSRFLAYGSRLAHSAFSSNFLVPFFASFMNLASVGFLKLMSNVAHSTSNILRKVYGSTARSILAHTKVLPIDEKQQAFSLATNQLYQVLYGVAFSLIINGYKIAHLGNTSAILIILFFGIHFSEHLFAIHEKLYITEERGHYATIAHLASFVLTYMVVRFLFTQSHTVTLAALLLVRILTFMFLELMVGKLWNIRSSWRMNPYYAIGFIGASLAFYFTV